MHDSPPSRLSITLGAAAALHLACALFGYLVAREEREKVLDAPTSAETEIDVLELEAIVEPSAAAPDEPSPRSTALSPGLLGRVRDRRAAPAENGPPGSTAPAETAGNANGEYALDPSAPSGRGATAESHISLGIGAGDWSRWVDPNAVPAPEGVRPSELPAPASSTGGLAEALEARDRSLGLGPAGAVLSAVHEAGNSEVAPALGAATFSITVLRTGAIDVQLTGSNGHAADWAKVGESIAAAIRRKPPRIASTRIGVRLGVEVVAEERWPNGQATRDHQDPHITAALPVFQTHEAAKEDLLEHNPTAVPDSDTPATQSGGTASEAAPKPKLQANFNAPGIFVEGRGKVCSYKVGLSLIPISGGCDVANIGARARRVVSTRVISQTML
jgi:hypothetical protein